MNNRSPEESASLTSQDRKLVENTVTKGLDHLKKIRHPLTINPQALDRLLRHTMDHLALLLYEADRLARQRWGDDIQSGDVDLAKSHLDGKSKNNYWSLAIGCALGGAGIQGLADALLS